METELKQIHRKQQKQQTDAEQGLQVWGYF